MRRPQRIRVPLLLLPAVAACGADVDVGAARARTDTVGGVVHVTNVGDGLWDVGSAWRIDAAAALEIGAVAGPEPYVFGEVSSVLVADDGRIYVADTQALEIRVFSPDGEWLARFGRDGEGPGEFRHIGGLGAAPGGGVAALDGSLGRVSIFDAGGGFRRSFRLERAFRILRHGAPVRFDNRGRYHDLTNLSHSVGTDSMGVVRYGAEGGVEDTVVVAVSESPLVLVRRNGVPILGFPIPFAARPSSAVGPGGGIHATLGAEYRIARLSPEGDTVRVIRRAWEPPAVSGAERDSVLEAIRERYREAAGADPRDLPSIPERKPAILAVRVDDAAYLWVLRPVGSEPATMEWDVFDPEGRYLGALDVPPMNVMHIGERTIAGVVHDSLGVPRVSVVPLDRGAAGS